MPIFGDTNLSDERAMRLAFDSLKDMPLLDKVIKERGLKEELEQAELEMAVSEAMWKAAQEEGSINDAIFSDKGHIWYQALCQNAETSPSFVVERFICKARRVPSKLTVGHPCDVGHERKR